MIKIMALADLHEEDAILDRLRNIEENRSFDYLIIAGDIAEQSINYVEELSGIVNQAFYIPGNNENKEMIKIMEKKGFLVHEKRIEIKEGYNIVGFGYSNITPFNTPGELSEEEIYKKASKMNIDEKTILITHVPPKGILDSVKNINIGSESIAKIVKEKKPKINIFGHVHGIGGKQIFEKTLCVKIPSAYEMKCMYMEIKNGNSEVFFSDL